MFEFADNRWMARDGLIGIFFALVTALPTGYIYGAGTGAFIFVITWLATMRFFYEIRLRKKNNVSLFAFRNRPQKMTYYISEGIPSMGIAPSIRWTQNLPFENESGKDSWVALAVIAGFFGLLAIFSETVRGIIGFILALIFGGALLSFFYERFMKLVTRGNWREKPDLKRLQAQAHLMIEGDKLNFVWSRNTIDETTVIGSVPADQLKSFEISTSDEWFTALHESKPLTPYFIMMINTPEGGPQIVAAHAGSRAEIAELHSVMTRLFITNRPRLLNKSDPSMSQRADLDDQSDLPTHL